MAEDSFEGIARTLCALPPENFVAARDAAVRTARAGGDRPLATRLGALRRPTVSAWLTNLLRQESPEVLEALVGLGAELRQAQAELDGDDLRRLAAQRHQLVAALTGQVRHLARRHHRTVDRTALTEVEETLTAALADEAAGAQVLSGRLERPLRHVGFGMPGEGAPDSGRRSSGGAAPRLQVATPPRARAKDVKAAEAERRAAQQRAERRRAVEAADRAVEQAQQHLEEEQGRLTEAESARADATARVRELEDLLRDAQRCTAERELDVRSASGALDRADDVLAQARHQRRELGDLAE